MRILVAPDSFKGSLSARGAARAIARGAARAVPAARVDVCPLSDGGEGFLDVLAAAPGASLRTSRVTGPLGAPVDARWVLLSDGPTALLESAEVVGLAHLPRGAWAPTRTTTHGVGELVLEAVSAGARKVVIGLGGTATTDGGAGLGQALGVSFHGAPVSLVASDLPAVQQVQLETRGPRLRLEGVEIVALTDVDNPLTGASGAARVFAPQKGASPADVAELEAALEHLAALTGDAGTSPGDGAAGGLGYGLRVFAGARVRRGIAFVLEALGFDALLDGCDLVLTGEGRLDAQSARGKVIAGVCTRCQPRGVPVVALVGTVGKGAELLDRAGLTAHFALTDRGIDAAVARERAAELLEALAFDVVGAWRR